MADETKRGEGGRPGRLFSLSALRNQLPDPPLRFPVSSSVHGPRSTGRGPSVWRPAPGRVAVAARSASWARVGVSVADLVEPNVSFNPQDKLGRRHCPHCADGKRRPSKATRLAQGHTAASGRRPNAVASVLGRQPVRRSPGAASKESSALLPCPVSLLFLSCNFWV